MAERDSGECQTCSRLISLPAGWGCPRRLLTLGSWSRRRKELRERHSEGTRQSSYRRNPDVTFPAFDTAHVIPMQPGPGCQLLLRDVELLPQFTHPASNGQRKIASHASIVTTLTTIGLHTIVCITPQPNRGPDR